MSGNPLFKAIPCSSRCRNSEDEEEGSIKRLSIGMVSKFPVTSSECSAKLDTQTIKTPVFASGTTETPHGSCGSCALTELSETTDEEEENMGTVDSVTSTTVALPRLLGREQLLSSRLNDGDIFAAPSVDLNGKLDVARACAESAREFVLKRNQQVETRRTVIKEVHRNTNDDREAEANCGTFGPSDRTSSLVGLLGSQMLIPRNVSDMCPVLAPCEVPVALDADCDTKRSLAHDIARTSADARACPQLAFESFCARKNRALSREVARIPG